MQNVDFFRVCENFTFEAQKALFSIQNIKECFFLVLFCLKKTDKKKVDYWQKPWTNPFAKCQYFLTLLELHFSGLKSIVFYPEYQKMFLSGFFLLKKDIGEKFIFWQKKPWPNPFQKYRFFFIFYRTSLLRSKRHSSLSRILKKCVFFRFFCKTWEKGRFFWQKLWTNRLSKMSFFFRFAKLDCVSLKGIHFYTDYKKTICFYLILLKKK